VDLANMLNMMGAKISGAGTSVIKIIGVDALRGIKYTPMPDRIVAGTLIAATVACGGRVEITNCPESFSDYLSAIIKSDTCNICSKYGITTVESYGILPGLGTIETGPYPMFPTDMQAQICALAACSDGETTVIENVFENRYAHLYELEKLGAKISIYGNMAKITGKGFLVGGDMMAHDLRGGAGLLIAAMAAAGKSTLSNVRVIDRGYENIEKMFSALGAKITRTIIIP